MDIAQYNELEGRISQLEDDFALCTWGDFEELLADIEDTRSDALMVIDGDDDQVAEELLVRLDVLEAEAKASAE